MRKSLQSTLLLLGVCFALLIWFFGYEKTYRVKKDVADDKAKIIIALEKDQIQELEVERLTNPPVENQPVPANFKPVYETVKLRKSGADWNLYAPLQDAADASTVAGMIGTLTTTKQDRVLDENPKDLGEFGLKFPLIKIRIRRDAAAVAEEVWVGNNTPVGFNSYAKTASSPAVYRIARSLRTGFEKTLKDLRNKSILAIPRLEIAEVEISGDPTRASTILKKDPKKDEWTLSRENMPADGTEWNKTLNAVLDVRAAEFPSYEGKSLSTFGLEKPVRRITITKTDKTKLSLALGRVVSKENGKEFQKVYLKREDKPTIYQVEKEVLDKASRSPDIYRSLLVAKFNRYDVSRIKLERANEPLELAKEAGKWTFAGDAATNLDATKVDGLLTKLQDLKLEKYLSEQTPKLTAASTDLTLRIFEKKEEAVKADPKQSSVKDEGKEVAVLKFGKPKSKLVTVERSDLAVPFLIKESDYQNLNLKKAHLMKMDAKEDIKKKAPKKEGVEKS